MKRRLVALTLAVATLLVACNSKQGTQQGQEEQNLIYMSDARNVATLDLEKQDITITKSETFVQSLSYDPIRKRVVAPAFLPEGGFRGLLLIEGGKSTKYDLDDKGFGPVHMYQHGDYYVMDSARIVTSGPYIMTDTIIYDVTQDKTIKKFQIPGQVKDIAGSGTKVYVSGYYYPKSKELQGSFKSNIYEIDLEQKTMRKVFAQDQLSVPFNLEVHGGYVYGVYRSALNVPPEAPQNLFVQIDPQKGEIVQKVQLAPYARDLAITEDGKYAFVSHFYQLGNQEVAIDTPVSRVDLKTWEVQKGSGDYRAASILSQKGKVYLGSDLQPELTVVDEKTLQVDQTLAVDMAPIYLANTLKTATPHD